IAARSDAIELDLVRYGTEAAAEEIRYTAGAKPMMVAAGLHSAAALGASPDVVAGHSVGEITAASFAGVIGEEAAHRFVRTR
ncbi:ACP S-malonyltransferase, partial [Streptomyces sp. DT225]